MAVDTLDTAPPAQQPNALDRLLDAILAGDDVTLFIRSDDGHRLLDAAAECLGTLRCRVFRAEGALPEGLSLPVLMRQAFGQPAPGVQNDEFLKLGFQAFTTLDAACDRIVLLISDANTLRPSALRYIQLACRAGTNLQLVLAGKRGFLDLLGPNEFAYLRERLATGPIITPSLPGPRAAVAQPAPAAPAAAPLEPVRGPAFKQAEMQVGQQHSRPMLSSFAYASRRSRVAALAGIGVGVAACIAAAIWTGTREEPVIPDQQMVLLVEPPPVSDTAAAALPEVPPVPAAAPLPEVSVPEIPVLQALRPPAPAQDASVPVAPAPSAAIPVPPNPPKVASRKLVMQRVMAARAAALGANSVAAWEDPYSPSSRDLRSMPPKGISDPPEQAKSYIGTYTTDANGARVFRFGQ